MNDINEIQIFIYMIMFARKTNFNTLYYILFGQVMNNL